MCKIWKIVFVWIGARSRGRFLKQNCVPELAKSGLSLLVCERHSMNVSVAKRPSLYKSGLANSGTGLCLKNLPQVFMNLKHSSETCGSIFIWELWTNFNPKCQTKISLNFKQHSWIKRQLGRSHIYYLILALIKFLVYVNCNPNWLIKLTLGCDLSASEEVHLVLEKQLNNWEQLGPMLWF
jgi:hypothetical protein